MQINALTEAAESFLAQGRWSEAADIYARLASLYPQQPDIHHVHALVLIEQKLWRAALEQIDQAIALDPCNAAYYRSRGDALSGAGKLQLSAEAFLSALSLNPDDIDAMINLGNTLHALDRTEQALQWYRKAANRDPANLMALNNIGKTLHDQGLMDHALQWYNKALDVNPDYAEARFNRSVLFLAQGDYSRGWKEYEWRFKRKSAHQVYPRKFKTEGWNGSSYTGKRLLVHCEQGMGDVIQFCRYLPQVKALGGTLIVEAHGPLVPLLTGMNAVDQVVPFSANQYLLPEFDLYVPLLSLPRLMQSSLKNLPNQVPYLHAAPQSAASWRAKSSHAKGLRIGLVWSGSAVDPRRACTIEILEKLFAIADTHFFSLQKGLTDQSLKLLAKYPNVTLWGDQLNDFGETAAAIEDLDLIISVDTAAAHLAGALGKPLWVLLPAVADWRWLLDRTDSPWYPTARLFRQQKAGDWTELLHRVCTELKLLAAVHGSFERGRAYHAQDRLDDAIEAYTKTIDQAPGVESAHRNLALAYFQKGDTVKAAERYERCLKLNPNSVEVLANLGAAYQNLQQPSRALACYARALDIDPRYVPAIYNQGNIHLNQGDLDAAAVQYRRALAIIPGHIGSMCNLGRAFHRMGLLDDALDLYDRALEIAPRHPETRFNRAITLLLQGRWSEGWPDYEWRFQCHNRRQIYPHQLQRPRWRGEPFNGKTLLVHGEQGLGDALQFVRFLPWVRRLGGRVLFETHKSLLSLFKKAAGIDALLELSPQHPPTQHYDLHIPLCSLPGLFNLTPDNLPFTKPYLSASQGKVKQWRTRLPQKGINAGLVWSGSNTYPERSCCLRDLAQLGQLEGINWIGLQKGPGADQINDPDMPAGLTLSNWGAEFADFSDTAAAIASLDLIISIDTSVAHLAGALGKPTWLLLPCIPDWRWLLQRADTTWYPSMRLFRQTQSGDWRSVVQEVCTMLEKQQLG